MTPKTLTYYDWFEDIQPYLCNAMGIKEEQFRDYHSVIAPGIKGVYYDLWHVWLDLFGDRIHNDSWDTIYFPENEEGWEALYNSLEDRRREPDDWSKPLIEATKSLQRYLGNAEKVVIYYSW